MLFPFKIIESRISSRDQFDILEGYQPTYALFYLKKGNFEIEIGGIKEKIGVGDCVILTDYIFFNRNVLKPIEFVYIKFAENPSCPYSFSIPYGKIKFKDERRFISSILAIEQTIMNDSSISVGYREHLLLDILFQIRFEQEPVNELFEDKKSYDDLVSSAVSYIAENIGEKILIEDICRSVGTNASTLNFKFRRHFDVSVGGFILNERIKKAKRLLVGTTYSISEIALRCGFDNVYYFSNTFKKVVNMSPSEYIKSYHG